jgi:hypothetical protein
VDPRIDPGIGTTSAGRRIIDTLAGMVTFIEGLLRVESSLIGVAGPDPRGRLKPPRILDGIVRAQAGTIMFK